MTRQTGIKVENSFTKGLITEATGLNFPQDAAEDMVNCRIDKKGELYRRLGIDLESLTETAANGTTGVVNEYLWEAVGDSGERTFLCVQIGDYVQFFTPDSNGDYSGGATSFFVYLPTYAVTGATDTHLKPCDFDSGNGRLFITHPQCDPIVVEYDSSSDNITITTVTIKIRDREGVDDGLEVDERPNTLSNLHRYNLSNQSWNEDVEIEDEDGSVGTALSLLHSNSKGPPSNVWPSNADVWWYWKSGADRFKPRDFDVYHIGTSPAPKGHWIYEAFDLDRTAKTGYSGLPSEKTNSRPSHVAFYAGRAWYAGVSDDKYTQRIYYTRIIESERDYGKCYTDNDPTSEELSDPIDSDGGVITIMDMGVVKKLTTVGDAIVIFSTKGVWTISGGDGTGFIHTDFNIRKITSVPAISLYSFVDVDGLPVWWNFDGIYALRPNEGGNALQVQSITEDTIKGFFQDIPRNSRYYAKGAYNRLTQEVQWLWKSTDVTDVEDNFNYDRILLMDTQTGAFSPWEVSNILREIAGIFVGTGDTGLLSEENVVDENNLVVEDEAAATVTATVNTQSRLETMFKYITRNGSSQPVTITFSDEPALGEYDLRAQTHDEQVAGYDWVNRVYYLISNNTGAGGEDELHKRSMVDHSLVSTVNIAWDTWVSSGYHGNGFFDENTGYLFVGASVITGPPAADASTVGIMVIDPSDGSIVNQTDGSYISLSSTAPRGNQWGTLSDGTIVIVHHSTSSNIYSLMQYKEGTWSYFGTISDNNQGFEAYVGHIIDGGTFKMYWHDGTNILEQLITTAGWGSSSTYWAAPPAGAYFLLPDGHVCRKDGLDLYKYSFTDGLFTLQWSNTSAISTTGQIFPHWSASRIQSRLVFIQMAHGFYDVVEMDDGAVTNYAKTVDGSDPDSLFAFDDPAGSGWWSNQDAVEENIWRWQVGPTGYTAPPTSDADFGFAEEKRTDYTDWVDADSVNSVGVDYDSYATVGYYVDGEVLKDFQSNYVRVVSKTEANSSCYMHGRFDWSNDGDSGKYSTPQQIYPATANRDYQHKRLRVRGHGPALQLHFASETGKPFKVVGWGLLESTTRAV